MPADTDAPPAPQTTIRAGGCDGCTLCCKVMAVGSIEKPAYSWCRHCRKDSGCGIYETRPAECSTFVCGWLSIPELPAAWKPSVSRLIVSNLNAEGNIAVYVDPARPDAWHRQPYLGLMQNWARQALAAGRRVVVRVGERHIVIMPDHAIDLGAVGDDELIVILAYAAGIGGGARHQVFAAKKEVWAKVGFEVAHGTQPPPLAGGFRSGTRV